jgi:2-keto-4-pentenoate hydratase/2-oxohepta-3-ene-1,7-dioic acid hydratase in catechol pathway
VTAPVRLVRCADGERVLYGLLEADDRVREIAGDITSSTLDLARIGGPAPGATAGAGTRPASSRPIAELLLLPPCAPSKIVAVGRNYREHAAELGHDLPAEPLLFLKPSTALLAPGGTILLPRASERVDYEGELGVVIGRPARRVPISRALDYVLGYTCVNDVTARDLQRRDVQFTRAKSFDTFCPLGPCIATGLRPEDLVVETRVNGVLKQSAPVSRMIFGVAELVGFISQIMTLLPGDVIATGTPEGVGPLAAGDEVTVSIEGIGRLTNRVAAADL